MIGRYTFTFDDLQIIPAYNSVESREHCNTESKLVKEFYLKVPIISSPMDTVTESDMIIELNNLGATGILHRFMPLSERIINLKKCKSLTSVKPIIPSIGTSDEEFSIFTTLWNDFLSELECPIILIDTAHGHSIHVERIVKKIKDFCNIEIIAGNIVTSNAAEDLIKWGVSGLRVGVGNGCFTPEMLVKLDNNIIKSIKNVKIGDIVITHTGEPKEIIAKFEFDRDEEIMEINGIECTKNHEFYVVNKKYEGLINENNIHDYAEWISADKLTNDCLLIEL